MKNRYGMRSLDWAGDLTLIRSWPQVYNPAKSCVIDQMTRFYMHDYDYSDLGKLDRNILLVEWDMAFGPEQLHAFIEFAGNDLEQVSVAAYRLYEARPWPVWAHRHVNSETGVEQWIEPEDSECDYFGFGMAYLPIARIREFLATPKETRGTPIGIEPARYTDYRLTDQTFSVWHHRSGYGPARVNWSALPVHLNY